MKIVKELKDATFEYDEDSKSFCIKSENSAHIEPTNIDLSGVPPQSMLKLFDEINDLSGGNLLVVYNENNDSYSVKIKSKIKLNKVYAFSFMRFVVRMAQRNWFRMKKPLDKNEDPVLEYKDQLEMF
jgi:hypothetical protein